MINLESNQTRNSIRNSQSFLPQVSVEEKFGENDVSPKILLGEE